MTQRKAGTKQRRPVRYGYLRYNAFFRYVQHGLAARERAVLGVLVDHCDGTDLTTHVWLTQHAIGEMINLHRNTVAASLKLLREMGWIEKIRQRNGPNRKGESTSDKYFLSGIKKVCDALLEEQGKSTDGPDPNNYFRIRWRRREDSLTSPDKWGRFMLERAIQGRVQHATIVLNTSYRTLKQQGERLLRGVWNDELKKHWKNGPAPKKTEYKKT